MPRENRNSKQWQGDPCR